MRQKNPVSFIYTQGIKKYLSQPKKKKNPIKKNCPEFQSMAYTSYPTQ